jgi:RND family efflux transporter MFP subunit
MKTVLTTLALLACGAAVSFGVESSTAKPSDLDEFTYDGVAQPSRVIHLGAAIDGLLGDVTVDRGDSVKAGQVVALLDASVDEAEAQLAAARAQRDSSRKVALAKIADAERRLNNQEALLIDGFITPEEVDETRTELRIEQLNLAQEDQTTAIRLLEQRRAEATLAQASLTSPIDGIVTERFLSPGEILSRSGQSEVLTIAQLDPLHVELHVPIDLLESISVGQTARVRLDAPGSPERSAEVLIKDRLIDTASRTFRVRLELANPDYELPAGLRCRVSFDE